MRKQILGHKAVESKIKIKETGTRDESMNKNTHVTCFMSEYIHALRTRVQTKQPANVILCNRIILARFENKNIEASCIQIEVEYQSKNLQLRFYIPLARKLKVALKSMRSNHNPI